MTKPPIITNDQGAPYSQEAEEATLGGIMLDPQQYQSVATFLKADDFFLLRHNYIWKAFDNLFKRSEPIDHITLAEELENMKVLDQIGGRAYLMQLVNNTGTYIYTPVYGRLVERTSIRRKAMAMSDEVKQLAKDETINIETFVSHLHNKALSIQSSEASAGAVTLYEALSQYHDRMEYMLQHTEEAIGIPSGYRDIDQVIGGWKRGQLITIAGRPGTGKTALMICLAINAARHGQRVLFDTLEMPIDELVNRMVSIEAGINVQKLTLMRLTAQEASRVTEAIGRMAKWSIWLWDTPRVTVPQLSMQARRIRHEHGLDLIVVDYVQLMDDHAATKNGNRVQEVSHITREMKQMALELQVPVIQGAQLSRAVEQRKDKRPQLADLRESGSIENDSDIVSFIYRDEMYNDASEFPNQADIIFSKHRNGPTGTVSLYFEKSLTKFMDASVHRVDLSDLE